MTFNNTTANFTSTTQMKRATWLICYISRTIRTAAEFVYVTWQRRWWTFNTQLLGYLCCKSRQSHQLISLCSSISSDNDFIHWHNSQA